jgi:hypothetical protein
MLEIMASIVGVHSFYMNAAALSKDPLERMKLVMACSVAYIFPTHQFEKPVTIITYNTNYLIVKSYIGRDFLSSRIRRN